MTVTDVRALFGAIAIVASGVAAVTAQQPEAASTPSSASVERIRAALQTQRPMTSDGAGLFAPTKQDDFRLGLLTITPPDTAGQFIAVRVPIGDLTSRAAHFIATAQHRRAENTAHAEVVKALAEFQKHN